MYDLPSEDPEEPGLPDEFHYMQPELLRQTFRPPNYPADEIFVASDLNLYYDPRNSLWYKRPDWFAVLGVPRSAQQQDLRWSYVVWQEGVSPFLVVELLSPGTEQEDLGQTLREASKPPTKWEVYERMLRIPYYVVFDRYTNQMRAFRLVAMRYQEIPLRDRQFMWMEEVQLNLGLWQGEYANTTGLWLRFYDAQQQLVLFPEELALQQVAQERQQRELAQQQAEQERQRAERLANKLRSLGVDIEDLM